MKKLYSLLILVVFCAGMVTAQTVPSGMKYQAVARNLSGSVLPNQEVSLRMRLYTPGSTATVHYSEIQKATTNELGLFTLVIGGGTAESGTFANVPWSSQEIWMEVSIQDKGVYSIISSSKLLTVPYAFHAETATSLSGPGLATKKIADSKGNSIADPCNTSRGISLIRLLYSGTDNVIVKIYGGSNEGHEESSLLKTFTGVKDGDILVLDATAFQAHGNNASRLGDQIYMIVQTGTTILPATIIPTSGQTQIVTQLYNNFTVLSVLAAAEGKTPASTTECSVCNVPQNWIIGGNAASDLCNRLGTKNKSDLVFITSNIERARIFTSGDMEIKNSLTIDKNLTVGGNVNFGAHANLNGPLVVTDGTSSTNTTTGAVIVAGGTGIGENLNVGGATNITKALNVGGATTLQSNVTVNGPSTFNNSVNIAGATTLQNTLAVTGATTLASTLDVTGKTHFRDSVTFDKSVATNGAMTSSSLTIIGDNSSYLATFQNNNNGDGDGIKIKLGKSQSAYTRPSAPALTAQETQDIQDFKDLLRCDLPGGAGGKITLLGKIATAGAIEDLKSIAGIAVGTGNIIIDFLNTNLNLPLQIGPYTTPAFHVSDAIDVTGPINTQLGLPLVLPALDIPAIKFPALSTPKFTIHTPDPLPNFDFPGIKVTDGFDISPAIHLLNATTVMPKLPAFTIPALDIPKLNVLPQLTVMPKLPTISIPGITPVNIFSVDFWGIPDICLSDGAGTTPLNNKNEFMRFADKDDKKVGSIRGVSVSDWASNYLNPSFLFKLRGALLSSKIDKFHAQYHFKSEISTALASYATIGVEYNSGNGDYAEWLERTDKSEEISAGDIIAVKGGKISKDLKGAEQVMVVSSNPIMLGNAPEEGKNFEGNNIAFMGQVPVKIMGPVSTGDYIIGESKTPGYGIAKHENKMTVEDFKNAVGRSWVTDETEGPKMVNTVVGVHNNNFINIIKELKEKTDKNDARLKSIETRLNLMGLASGKMTPKKSLK